VFVSNDFTIHTFIKLPNLQKEVLNMNWRMVQNILVVFQDWGFHIREKENLL